jgi:hybrid cluster-associated redox disulfide protein
MEPPLHTECFVSEVMRQWPETIGVFVALRMACPGCPMAPFETLAEAAVEHGLEPQDLLARLRRVGPGGHS